jgi:hypothetical protein
VATFKEYHPATDSVALTITAASLASSSTFVAGRQSTAVANRANLDLDHMLSGKITVGTTPVINTQIQIWVVAAMSFLSSTLAWPDVVGASDAALTWTSTGIRDGAAILAKTLYVDSTTSNRAYSFGQISIAQLFGGMPTDWAAYLTHNTGVALHATGGNHGLWYFRKQGQSV